MILQVTVCNRTCDVPPPVELFGRGRQPISSTKLQRQSCQRHQNPGNRLVKKTACLWNPGAPDAGALRRRGKVTPARRCAIGSRQSTIRSLEPPRRRSGSRAATTSRPRTWPAACVSHFLLPKYHRRDRHRRLMMAHAGQRPDPLFCWNAARRREVIHSSNCLNAVRARQPVISSSKAGASAVLATTTAADRIETSTYLWWLRGATSGRGGSWKNTIDHLLQGRSRAGRANTSAPKQQRIKLDAEGDEKLGRGDQRAYRATAPRGVPHRHTGPSSSP